MTKPIRLRVTEIIAALGLAAALLLLEGCRQPEETLATETNDQGVAARLTVDKSPRGSDIFRVEIENTGTRKVAIETNYGWALKLKWIDDHHLQIANDGMSMPDGAVHFYVSRLGDVDLVYAGIPEITDGKKPYK